MSLPAPWVDKIFAKLTLAYGRDFLGRWEGLDINAVKSDWGYELAGFQQMPDAIAYGLQNLPEKCPNVFEFRAMCRRSPHPAVAQIEHSPAGKERIAEELKKLAPILKPKPTTDFRDWARRIVARHEGGERITRAQLAMARDALRGAA